MHNPIGLVMMGLCRFVLIVTQFGGYFILSNLNYAISTSIYFSLFPATLSILLLYQVVGALNF